MEDSGITTIPAPIVDAMFVRANNLLASPGSVIPKPGADDGSYIVAGSSNNVHSVNPGKGGSLSCDRTCINHANQFCEHVLAVAQAKGTLHEFIAWFKRKRKRPTMMDMVEQGGPKNAGRKPSGRKRTNAKPPPINKHVDLLSCIFSTSFNISKNTLQNANSRSLLLHQCSHILTLQWLCPQLMYQILLVHQTSTNLNSLVFLQCHHLLLVVISQPTKQSVKCPTQIKYPVTS